MFQDVVGQRKKFAIHALRPPIKKKIELQKSKQSRIELRIDKPKAVHLPRTLIFIYDQKMKKKQKIVKKTLKTTYFWGPGGVPLSKKKHLPGEKLRYVRKIH